MGIGYENFLSKQAKKLVGYKAIRKIIMLIRTILPHIETATFFDLRNRYIYTRLNQISEKFNKCKKNNYL